MFKSIKDILADEKPKSLSKGPVQSNSGLQNFDQQLLFNNIIQNLQTANQNYMLMMNNGLGQLAEQENNLNASCRRKGGQIRFTISHFAKNAPKFITKLEI